MIVDFIKDIGVFELIFIMIASFFLSYIIDLILPHHSFGIWGNMILLNIQSVLGFHFSVQILSGSVSFNKRIIFALVVAFFTVFILALIKSFFSKV